MYVNMINFLLTKEKLYYFTSSEAISFIVYQHSEFNLVSSMKFFIIQEIFPGAIC